MYIRKPICDMILLNAIHCRIIYCGRFEHKSATIRVQALSGYIYDHANRKVITISYHTVHISSWMFVKLSSTFPLYNG